MKKLKLFLVLALLAFTVQSCCWYGDCNDDTGGGDPITSFYNYDPVYMTRSDFEASVTVGDATPVVKAGKIYVIGRFLFINEVNQGFHVYDNQDPANPISLNFLNAPGSTDLSIRNDIYYINQATDLIAVRFNPLSGNPEVTKRIRNVFPGVASPDGLYDFNATDDQVVVNWTPIN